LRKTLILSMTKHLTPERWSELLPKLEALFKKQIIVCSIEDEKGIDVETAIIGIITSGSYSDKRNNITLNLSNIQVFQRYPDSRGYRISGREDPVVIIERGTFQKSVLDGKDYFQKGIMVVAPYNTEAFNNIVGYLSRR